MKIKAWQLFDEQGEPLAAVGAPKHEAVVRGLLHGASHVWMWRHNGDDIELLLQKRAAAKVNWPNLLDKSAGGHIALGESPTAAALRKVKDELGIELSPDDLQLAGVYRWHAVFVEETLIENEFQFIYLTEVGDIRLMPLASEVQGTEWVPLAKLLDVARGGSSSVSFVPYGQPYFMLLCEAVEHTAMADLAAC